MNNEIHIYVADLAAYNNGKLHGVWIDATKSVDEIFDIINVLLENSPEEDAEEFAIHDYEGFEGLNISEYEGIQSAHDKAIFIEEHGALGGAVASHFGSNLDDAKRALEEGYIGAYRSIEDYAREITEDGHELPTYIEHYIDYESMGRDMEMNGDFFTIELGYQKLHLFHNL
ncbi:MAG: antirestriction protein ArdA [Pseudomonadota bacterium]|nr:antirestriction protein ArdA [Pseudomonadota bacterium]